MSATRRSRYLVRTMLRPGGAGGDLAAAVMSGKIAGGGIPTTVV